MQSIGKRLLPNLLAAGATGRIELVRIFCENRFCSESFRLPSWQAENTASGQGSPRERSPVGSRFSESLLPDVLEQLRNKSELVGSDENHQVQTKLLKGMIPSGWILGKVFKWPSLQFLQKPGRCTLEPFPDKVCFLTDWSLYFLVYLSKLPLTFSYFSMFPLFRGKSFVSCEDWIDFLIHNRSVDLLYCEGKRFSTKANRK